MSKTWPRIFRITQNPAIGRNVATLNAPTTFGAMAVIEHNHSCGNGMSQHISDRALASFSKQSPGSFYNTSAVLSSGEPFRFSVCSVLSPAFLSRSAVPLHSPLSSSSIAPSSASSPSEQRQLDRVGWNGVFGRSPSVPYWDPGPSDWMSS